MEILLQSDRLPEFYRAIREQFSKGSSPTQALIAVGAVAALVLLVYVLNRLERRVAAPIETNDPQRLFHELLPKLGFNTEQRQFLEVVTHELHLKQPAAILLSEELFDQAVAAWSSRGTGRPDDPRTKELLRKARARLFPSKVGFVSSARPGAAI